MALVPYCAAPLGVANLAALKAMPERHYRVGEHFLTVEQHWAPDGRGGTALGFGGTCFDAAFLLADYLAKRVPLAGRTCVELGCGGAALASIAASLHGAELVVATDGDERLVDELAARNCARNSAAAWRAGRLRALPLLWGDAAQTESALRAAPGGFDVVVAADVVACPYADAFEPLLRTLDALSAPATLVLLAFQRRHHSETRFFELCAARFEISRVAPAELHPDFAAQCATNEPSALAIFRLRRRPVAES